MLKEQIIGEEKELEIIFGHTKSYYGKAITRTDESKWGKYHSLFSYGTFIIEIKEFDDGEKAICAFTKDEKDLTQTTLRHLNEFYQQHGFEKKTKKEWIHVLENQRDYDY